MASKRMFSKEIVHSSRILRLPPTCRLLYYDLGMCADDDGYCEWYPIIQMTGAKESDMQVLAAAGMIQVFDQEVLLIKDWKTNNLIRSDRYQASKHLAKYGSAEPHNMRLTDGIPSDNHPQPQVRLGKVSKDSAAGSAAGAFDLSTEIKRLEESERRDLNVIALYLEERRPDIRSKDQLSAAIKRHVRAARELKVFTDDQIVGAVPRAKAITDGWTIETLVKVLTK